MSLLVIAHQDTRGMHCEVLINPQTERLYAIAYFANLRTYIPIQIDKGRCDIDHLGPKDLKPIPVRGQPDNVYAFGTREEAYNTLEVIDCLK